MGIMAVAPSKESWMISSRPPWRWGGNMDFNKLTAGATLYLPVFHDGAQFFTGDSHAVQGDGEVNGTAIEASLTGTFQFIVHKGAGRDHVLAARRGRRLSTTPWAWTSISTWRCSNATQETVRSCRRRAGCRRPTPIRSPASRIDFRIAEVVDAVQLVYGAIPKKIFKTNPEYWFKR